MKFSFVILHYNTYNETLKCIEYIKQLDFYDNSKIIVIDNHSTDGSTAMLIESLSSDEIDLVSTEFNVGFAKGNNLGYSIAKHRYNSEFIIVMNSDVFIEQHNFLSLINSCFKETDFFLLGPAIYNLEGQNQNPVRYIHDDIRKINRTIFLNRLRIVKSYLPIKKNKEKETCNQVIEEFNTNDMCDQPIHGACVIASINFIQKHEYLFYPETFLYAEEDILYFFSKVNNEKIIYSPYINVIHAEDAATNNLFGIKNRKKKRFVLRNSINSLNILKKIMKDK